MCMLGAAGGDAIPVMVGQFPPIIVRRGDTGSEPGLCLVYATRYVHGELVNHFLSVNFLTILYSSLSTAREDECAPKELQEAV